MKFLNVRNFQILSVFSFAFFLFFFFAFFIKVLFNAVDCEFDCFSSRILLKNVFLFQMIPRLSAFIKLTGLNMTPKLNINTQHNSHTKGGVGFYHYLPCLLYEQYLICFTLFSLTQSSHSTSCLTILTILQR